MSLPQPAESFGPHSPAWIAQAWVSFVAATGTTALGIAYLPVDRWIQAFLGMGLLFSVGATLNLSKTIRDIHESRLSAARSGKDRDF